MEQLLILNSTQTIQKIKRIAFEIYENNYQENQIVLAGIYDKGYQFARLLLNELQTIAPAVQFRLIRVDLDKFSPLQSEIKLDTDLASIANSTVILVDDVLNSGRTLVYSLKPFLNIEIKKIQIAVLVDRGYKSFPVAADYIGYSLSTTLKEHIEVVMDSEESLGVYLN